MLNTLIRVRLQSLMNSMFGRMLRRRKAGRKSSPVSKVLMGLLILYIVVALLFAMGVYFMLMAEPMHQMGLDWLYFGLAALSAIMLSFIGSIFITQNQLFTARDNELLLSMPIKPGHILASRMITLLAVNGLYTLLVMLPAVVVWVIENGLSPAGLVGVLLGTLATPFLSLAISAACGWLLGLVTSRLKRKNLVTTLMLIAFFAGFMYLNMQLPQMVLSLVEQGAAVGDAVRRTVPPLYWFGVGAGFDSGIMVGLACVAICFCSIMVMPAAASISLEGRNLWILKAAPLTTGQILWSKLAVNLAASIPTGLVASLCCVWLLPCTALEGALIILLPASVGLFTALFGLSANLLMPRLDWVSEAVVVKNSGSVMITLFGSMAVLAVPVLLYAVWLGRLMAMGTFLLICLALMLALCAGLYAFITTRGKQLFEALA